MSASTPQTRHQRGEPPFDGSQFPRLPWGGTVVASDDIGFISDWIDDGCPENDRVLASIASSELYVLPLLRSAHRTGYGPVVLSVAGIALILIEHRAPHGHLAAAGRRAARGLGFAPEQLLVGHFDAPVSGFLTTGG